MMSTAIMPQNVFAQELINPTAPFVLDEFYTEQESLGTEIQPSNLALVTPNVIIGDWNFDGTITHVRIAAVPGVPANAPRVAGNSARVAIDGIPANGRAVTIAAIVYVRQPGLFRPSIPTARSWVVWVDRWTGTIRV